MPIENENESVIAQELPQGGYCPPPPPSISIVINNNCNNNNNNSDVTEDQNPYQNRSDIKSTSYSFRQSQ